MTNGSTPFAVSEVTDLEELARAQAQSERYRRNSDWLQAHVPEIYAKHRGKSICVAGQELFVADSTAAVIAMARTAHPEDDGFLLRSIPRVKMDRI